MHFDDFSVLPMCVLKDTYSDNLRVSQISINDNFKPNPRTLLYNVYGSGEGNYIFTKYHFHDGVEILRINLGKAKVIVNNRCFYADEGDIILVNPYEAHGIVLESPNVRFSRSCIIFKPSDIFPKSNVSSIFDSLRNISFVNHIRKSESTLPLIACIDKMISIAETNQDASAVEEIATLMQFYSLILSGGYFSEVCALNVYRSEFRTKISDYIESNMQSDISSAGAAKYCQYSEEHFCRLFKECFGTTFINYVTACKIRLAREIIDSGKQISVSELSSICGFKSQNHFTNMFLRHTGKYPSEYISNGRK